MPILKVISSNLTKYIEFDNTTSFDDLVFKFDPIYAEHKYIICRNKERLYAKCSDKVALYFSIPQITIEKKYVQDFDEDGNFIEHEEIIETKHYKKEKCFIKFIKKCWLCGAEFTGFIDEAECSAHSSS
jgi:hypothetical protein